MAYKRPDGLCELPGSIITKDQYKVIYSSLMTVTKTSSGINLWHRRLRHTSKDRIKQLEREGVVNGIYLQRQAEKIPCHLCAVGSHKKRNL